MRRLLAFVAASAVAAAGVAACSNGDDEPVTAESRPERTTTTTTAPPPPPPPVAPLTGLPDVSGLSLTRPALTVKVENSPQARPQAGLELADVVYEEVVEGGITRFVVMYNSSVPEVVGPIRSVRDMDPNIVWPLGGVFAFSGGAPGPVAHISDAPVTLVDEGATGTAMYRDRGRAAPHNLFGYGQPLFERGGVPVPPPPLFAYLADGETWAAPAPVQSFRVGFSAGYDPTWTWDPATGTWKRSYGSTPFMTASGTQVGAVNVVAQFIDYRGYSDGVTVGEGDVWVFSGGLVTRGRWIRPGPEQPAAFVDEVGNPIKLVPGPTWVELLPTGSFVDLVAPPLPPPPPPTEVPVTEAPTTTTEKRKKKNQDGDD
jgi:hypothetical protein